MKHSTEPDFWKYYDKLPSKIQKKARGYFQKLKENSTHPSLHFKKINSDKKLHSIRVGASHRALGRESNSEIVWFWIGSHSDYNNQIN